MPQPPLKWFDDNRDSASAWMKALNEVRTMATREGYCYHHVQSIILSIDQYAEAATGNREYFWNKPHNIP